MSSQTSRRTYGVLVLGVVVGVALCVVGLATDAAFTRTVGYLLAVGSAGTGFWTVVTERRRRSR